MVPLADLIELERALCKSEKTVGYEAELDDIVNIDIVFTGGNLKMSIETPSMTEFEILETCWSLKVA